MWKVYKPTKEDKLRERQDRFVNLVEHMFHHAITEIGNYSDILGRGVKVQIELKRGKTIKARTGKVRYYAAEVLAIDNIFESDIHKVT